MLHLPLYKPWVACYNWLTTKGKRTADSDSSFPILEKKSLTSYRKYATIVNVKRRYQKESRLTGRGQGRKLLTNYSKYAILESRKERIQKVRQPRHSNPCRNGQRKLSGYKPTGLLSPSSLNRAWTLKTEHWCYWRATAREVSSSVGVGTWWQYVSGGRPWKTTSAT